MRVLLFLFVVRKGVAIQIAGTLPVCRKDRMDLLFRTDINVYGRGQERMGKMKRKMFPRKILCGMLSLVLAASCLPISAGARLLPLLPRSTPPGLLRRRSLIGRGALGLPGGAITKEEMVREVDLRPTTASAMRDQPFGGGLNTDYNVPRRTINTDRCVL